MNENETKLTDFETKEIDNIQKKSNIILFSDYTPSDILGIGRVSLLDRPRSQHFDDRKSLKRKGNPNPSFGNYNVLCGIVCILADVF